MENYLTLLPDAITLKGNYKNGEVYIDGKKIHLQQSLKVNYMSPSGFAWGYSGRGPAQLALAILLHYWPQEVALFYFQDFKSTFISTIPQRDFLLSVNLQQLLTDIVNKSPVIKP